jgi:hypothetical protein
MRPSSLFLPETELQASSVFFHVYILQCDQNFRLNRFVIVKKLTDKLLLIG